jgi:hypothetical protein
MRADSLEVIILKQREIEKFSSNESNKRQQKRKVKFFFKGTVAGVI